MTVPAGRYVIHGHYEVNNNAQRLSIIISSTPTGCVSYSGNTVYDESGYTYCNLTTVGGNTSAEFTINVYAWSSVARTATNVFLEAVRII